MIDFVKGHAAYVAPIVFVLACAESIVLFSVFIPASVILVGIGALVAVGEVDLLAVVVAATLGAALGEWLSYALGCVLKERATRVWPLDRHPELLVRSRELIRTWGVLGIFVAKIIGPLRGVAPLLAGVGRMPHLRFQVVNCVSSLTWAVVWLAPGYVSARFLQ